MNRYQHELKRNLRFESGQVAAGSDPYNPNLNSNGREYPRTQTANSLPEDLSPGQRTVILSGGDNDYPITIGIDPFLS